ncbi:hypothetical protein P171DRAFT_440957 [Karstenula rhodostoma CBS 690.94]|uniref:Uncharacterized protein n=1 Tax=Karstenula rhodostoma CBS 690.94 TaxID=1392251 RepID=A0A9P4PNY2_9PLEO|nr:hypothetical protein P171DRAFT_440957 [Karstenula rhodostoma CBS 690.94]
MAFKSGNGFPVEQLNVCLQCLAVDLCRCEIPTALQMEMGGAVYFNLAAGQPENAPAGTVSQAPVNNDFGFPTPPQGVPATGQRFHFSVALPDWPNSGPPFEGFQAPMDAAPHPQQPYIQHAAIPQQPHAAPQQLPEEPRKPEKKRGRPKNSRDKVPRNRKGEGLAKKAIWARPGRPSKHQKQALEELSLLPRGDARQQQLREQAGLKE